jgi:hypothetical protein
MEGNPGDAAPADRPDQPGRRWWPAGPVRASDADRDAVISELRERYAEGRLTHDTLDQRLGAALRARYQHDLADVVADLPSRRRLGAAVLACWQRGRATLAGLVAGGSRPAPVRLLAFPSGGQNRFTIGRDLGCDMVLPDPTISRWHAGLKRGASGWMLDDLGSTNGTRLNGWQVRAWVPVRDGDLVSFGAATYVFGRPGGGRGLSQAGGWTSR